MEKLNQYGDTAIKTIDAHGVDIAIQRADDLDKMALALIDELSNAHKPVRVIDIGCGQGGQLARMIKAGATLAVGVDTENYSDAVFSLADPHCHTVFVQGDLAYCEEWVLPETQYEIVLSQRTIHYIPYMAAVSAINGIADLMHDGSRLFISASGLHSELGIGYADADKQIGERFGFLAQEMQEKHNIKHKVCLYSLEDMETLLVDAGMHVEFLWKSDFGNIKAVAKKAV